MSNLTDKQKLFVERYVIHLNATRAAKEAGYSSRTARSVGSENLTKPDILKEIEKVRSEAMKRNQIELDEVLTRFATLTRTAINPVTYEVYYSYKVDFKW